MTIKIMGGHGKNRLTIEVEVDDEDSEDDNSEAIELDGIKAPAVGWEGFSETSYNIIAFYEKNAFQGLIAYNWQPLI